MGAVAISDVRQLGGWPFENGKKAVLAKLTMSASYATNGDTLAGQVTLGLRRVDGMLIVAHATSGTYGKIIGTTVAVPIDGNNATLAGTAAAPKIKLTKGGQTPVEETNATDCSSTIFWAILIGED